MNVQTFPHLVMSSAAIGEATPFSQEVVMLSRQEYVRLVTETNYWKSVFERAAARADDAKAWSRRELERTAARFEERIAGLQDELQITQAKVRDLEQRLFGRKSERSVIDDKHRMQTDTGRSRGQQPGSRGHGRKCFSHLPAHIETVELESPCCPDCGLLFSDFPGTDDCEVIEIEVKAHRRVIQRHRYKPVCHCDCNPGIVTAPAPPQLIPRGKFGVSVWVHILLDKFLYGRPTFRLLQDLADLGLPLSAGSVVGGLETLAALFEPLWSALLDKLVTEPHWHADETRWEVFEEVDGKSGHRWYLWVFKSRSVVYYLLDPSRSSAVPMTVLAEAEGGIISCDRHGAYKKFARQRSGFILSFCWVHQRRDLLNLANSYPALSAWAFAWIDRIGELFVLHAQRLEAFETQPESGHYRELDQQLRHRVDEMATLRTQGLADPALGEPAVKLLKSMGRHWEGLTVFVDNPQLPLENNAAERALRGPVVGRKNYYGSGAKWSGALAAMMFSVLHTLRAAAINPRIWLTDYLQACAAAGGNAPADLAPFLPWTMDEIRRERLRASPSG